MAKIVYEIDIHKIVKLNDLKASKKGRDGAGWEIRTEAELCSVIKFYGGRLFLVGGGVRDGLLGQEPHDRDYVAVFTCGMAAARRLVSAKHRGRWGREYPVFRFRFENGEEVELSFATGTIMEDLSRRDLTINAMAIDVATGVLIDPFGGQEDLRAGIIRHVNPQTFNPLAAFRAARFACKMQANLGRDFTVTTETLAVMNNCRPDAAPPHRIRFELRSASQTGLEDKFFETLEAAGIWLYFRDIEEDYWGNTTEPVVFLQKF